MKKSRRSFVKTMTGGLLATAAPTLLLSQDNYIETLEGLKKHKTANDKIQLGIIGMGIQGYMNAKAALGAPGAKLVAACDLYDGRLQSVKETYGNDIYTTRNHEELLARKDVDAVIIATSDHWHDVIAIDAMKAGKAVYCEKPMVHKIEQGKAIVEAEQKYKSVFQVGSQRVSAITTWKAKELIARGDIGEVIMAEAWFDRQSAVGAWQYSIPTDASEKTVDWKRFLHTAPKMDFDATRFFRWRNYQDYGTGVAGDLFVHLFSGLHCILDSYGPTRIYTTGGLRYWKDGRDVPDVMIGVCDYPATDKHPAFNLQLRVNFVDGKGGGGGTRIIGTEGVLDVGYSDLTVTRSKMKSTPGYKGYNAYFTFSKAEQAAYEKWYKNHYGAPKPAVIEPKSVTYKSPEGYSDHEHHYVNFYDSIRNGTKVVEDAAFGLRASAPSLAANMSYFENRPIDWDPIKMELK